MLIRHREQYVDLGTSQKVDWRMIIALTRDGQDALDQTTMAGRAERRILEKRVNGREADVTASSARAPRVLEVIEKRTDSWRIEIVKCQR